MTYTWVFLALISAFALATSDAYTKKALATGNLYLVAGFRLLFSLPLLFLLLFFIPLPVTDREFYKAFGTALPLEAAATVLYIKALKISPLSLTLPFLSLTPLFLILVSYVIVGEKVSLQGGAGIILLTAGSFTLNIHEMRKGILEPFKAITKEKGSVLMAGVALIYSLTSSLGKRAIEHSSPLFFGITYFTALTVIFVPLSLWLGRSDIKRFISGQKFRRLMFPGFFYSVMIITHMLALSLTKVAYMISVKRTSLIMGLVYGYFLFGEKNMRERTAGSLLMLAGFILIVTA